MCVRVHVFQVKTFSAAMTHAPRLLAMAKALDKTGAAVHYNPSEDPLTPSRVAELVKLRLIDEMVAWRQRCVEMGHNSVAAKRSRKLEEGEHLMADGETSATDDHMRYCSVGGKIVGKRTSPTYGLEWETARELVKVLGVSTIDDVRFLFPHSNREVTRCRQLDLPVTVGGVVVLHNLGTALHGFQYHRKLPEVMMMAKQVGA